MVQPWGFLASGFVFPNQRVLIGKERTYIHIIWYAYSFFPDLNFLFLIFVLYFHEIYVFHLCNNFLSESICQAKDLFGRV